MILIISIYSQIKLLIFNKKDINIKESTLFYKHKTKHFLLLEVMIAFTLMFCFTFPFLKRPYALLQFEKKRLIKIEKERIAYLSFSEILEKLYKNEIPQEDLNISSEKKAKTYLLPFYRLHTNQTITRNYMLVCKTKKNTQRNTICKKIKIVLFLKDDNSVDKFKHYVLVEEVTGLQQT